jgi:hypothetical protein
MQRLCYDLGEDSGGMFPRVWTFEFVQSLGPAPAGEGLI